MKHLIYIILLGLSTITAVADDFKILYLTSPDITIDGKACKVGDTFSRTSSIVWTAPRQAMKVIDLTTKKQNLIVAEEYAKNKSRDIASYLVATKHLSTRRGELINTVELGVVLGETHYLLDTLKVETRLPIDENHFFYASYIHNGETINKKLNSNDNTLIFDRSIYTIDGNAIRPFDVTLNVWYMDMANRKRTLITDKMVILPLGE